MAFQNNFDVNQGLSCIPGYTVVLWSEFALRPSILYGLFQHSEEGNITSCSEFVMDYTNMFPQAREIQVQTVEELEHLTNNLLNKMIFFQVKMEHKRTDHYRSFKLRRIWQDKVAVLVNPKVQAIRENLTLKLLKAMQLMQEGAKFCVKIDLSQPLRSWYKEIVDAYSINCVNNTDDDGSMCHRHTKVIDIEVKIHDLDVAMLTETSRNTLDTMPILHSPRTQMFEHYSGQGNSNIPITTSAHLPNENQHNSFTIGQGQVSTSANVLQQFQGEDLPPSYSECILENDNTPLNVIDSSVKNEKKDECREKSNRKFEAKLRSKDKRDIRICKATYSRKKRNKKELSFKKDDILIVLDSTLNWWLVENFKGKKGYVPFTALLDITI